MMKFDIDPFTGSVDTGDGRNRLRVGMLRVPVATARLATQYGWRIEGNPGRDDALVEIIRNESGCDPRTWPQATRDDAVEIAGINAKIEALERLRVVADRARAALNALGDVPVVVVRYGDKEVMTIGKGNNNG